MTLGPLFWIGIKGLKLSAQEIEEIESAQVSGIILFKRNIKSLPQLFELCHKIHSLNPRPLIIMDREGGMVDRLRHLPEYPPWPKPWDLARVCSLEEIERTAFYKAEELSALGICTSLAPCLDIPSAQNPLFEGRLLGKTPQEIQEKALAYLRGIRRAGLATSAKHFPGHGGVTEDSHFLLPEDLRDFQSLEAQDLIPFQKAIEFNVEIIMTAHVLYSQVDPLFPATLSKIFLKKILREKMNFKGLIVSDDLDMGALRKTVAEEATEEAKIMAGALKAGVDILLKCEPSQNFLKELEDLSRLDLEELTQRGSALQEKLLRLKTFRQKYQHIKPASSLEELKKQSFNLKAKEWRNTLFERIK